MNEFMQRPSRPTAPAPNNGPNNSVPVKKSKGFNLGNSLHIGVGLLLFSGVVIAFGVLALLLINNKSEVQKENERIIEDTFQAVFLNDPNGQVYFGDLERINSDTYRLSDIYYVQVQTAIQPDTGEQTAAGVSLAKLGNELHGPLDAMYINKDHVLFWENLKTSGQVVCAIVEYKTTELGIEGLTKDEGCDANTNENAAGQPQETGAGSGDTATQATQPAGTPQQDDTPQNTDQQTPDEQ